MYAVVPGLIMHTILILVRYSMRMRYEAVGNDVGEPTADRWWGEVLSSAVAAVRVATPVNKR